MARLGVGWGLETQALQWFLAVVLPHFLPMPLRRLPEPFDHPGWIFEVKHDGFRGSAHIGLSLLAEPQVLAFVQDQRDLLQTAVPAVVP
jgi:hypothetical protein